MKTDNITVTGTKLGFSSLKLGNEQQAWRRLPKDITPVAAAELDWVVIAESSGVSAPLWLVLCEQVTYYGSYGPNSSKTGTYWEPVKFKDIPHADLPDKKL